MVNSLRSQRLSQSYPEECEQQRDPQSHWTEAKSRSPPIWLLGQEPSEKGQEAKGSVLPFSSSCIVGSFCQASLLDGRRCLENAPMGLGISWSFSSLRKENQAPGELGSVFRDWSSPLTPFRPLLCADTVPLTGRCTALWALCSLVALCQSPPAGTPDQSLSGAAPPGPAQAFMGLPGLGFVLSRCGTPRSQAL